MKKRTLLIGMIVLGAFLIRAVWSADDYGPALTVGLFFAVITPMVESWRS